MSNTLVNSSTRSLTESIFYSFRDRRVTVKNLILQIKKKAYEYDAAFSYFLLIEINDFNYYILLLVDKPENMSIGELINKKTIYDYIISLFVLDKIGREEFESFYIVSQATMDDFETASVYFNEIEVDLPYIFNSLDKKNIEIFSHYDNE